jgi:hypothetical protein
MVEDEFDFPIAKPLISVSVWESKEFGSDELCLEEVKLIFQGTELILKPIVDTDEIEITLKTHQYLRTPSQIMMEDSGSEPPIWCDNFIGKKLQTVWVCENCQGYRDQVILAFQHLHPSISFVAEGSVIKVFSLAQIKQEKISPTNLEKAGFNS